MIGARNSLIAFNVYLTTSEVEIAKKIAKAIRQSSGGLRYVKALGLLVEGRAQVSMNLTNFRETPIGRVVETVRREAQRYGVAVHHSELVGLIPQEALIDAAVWYTQLDQFSAEQILETRLYQAGDSQSKKSSASFLDDLAAASAAPGGGSAAAYAGAMGAALVAMVAGLTIGKKKYLAVEAEMQAIRVQAEELRKELTDAVEDEFGGVRSGDGRVQTFKGNRGTTKGAHRRDTCCDDQCRICSIANRQERGQGDGIGDTLREEWKLECDQRCNVRCGDGTCRVDCRWI